MSTSAHGAEQGIEAVAHRGATVHAIISNTPTDIRRALQETTR